MKVARRRLHLRQLQHQHRRGKVYSVLRFCFYPLVLSLVLLINITDFTWRDEGSGIRSSFGDGHVSTYRKLLQSDDSPDNATETAASTSTGDKKFPPDLFSEPQRKQGAIVLHIFGVIYMFIALAVVCDEFFIPALEVITEKLGVSEDVAGATFMAAGGSAPELFTSVIGVFISKDDVGIGTIVGSAVFNILFVLSMCAIFSKSVLELTWWPLFRDVSFYSLILITLMVFFRDNRIEWWESTILLWWYVAYVTFMKFNEKIEHTVKKTLARGKVGQSAIDASESNGGPASDSSALAHRRSSIPILHGGGSKFRQGVLQLMISSVDPLNDGTVDPEKFRAAMMKGGANGDANRSNSNGGVPGSNGTVPSIQVTQMSDSEKETPLDVSWPKEWHKQITYVILFPITIPLWFTLPDVRRPEKRKFFAFSFVGSILWIALYSYLMVWWATLVGDCFNVPPEVMGLTFLAAGTSIPDLITSVLVARKGFGDMAVSSSVGSNIFDVAVGLPFPWLLYGILFGTVQVNSAGMACSIMILFAMLLFVIITIAAFKWRLNIGMAIVMFILYILFMIVSLMLEKGVIKCKFAL